MRKDRKDKPEEAKETPAEESKKSGVTKQKEQKRKSNIPEIFLKKHEQNEEITKMR